MNRKRMLAVAAIGFALAAMQMETGAGVAQARHNGQVPRFEYIGENFDARRVQRFLYKGLGSPTSPEGVIPPARAVQ